MNNVDNVDNAQRGKIPKSPKTQGCPLPPTPKPSPMAAARSITPAGGREAAGGSGRQKKQIPGPGGDGRRREAP